MIICVYPCSVILATLASDMLEFTSFVFVASTEGDTGVHLSAAIQNDEVPNNSSLLRHVRLISPTKGIRIYGRPPLLDHVTVFNSTTSGLSLTDFLVGNFSARHCDFSGNQQHGIYIMLHKSNVHADITHTTLNDNGRGGVMVEYLSSGSVTMSHNTFGNNLQCALDVRDIRGSLTLAKNSFTNNTSTGYQKSIVYLPHVYHGSHLQIVDNTFMNNSAYYRRRYYGRHYANYVIYIATDASDIDCKASIITSACFLSELVYD